MFRQKYPEIMAPQYTCFGVHIRTFASIIAIFGIIYCVFEAIDAIIHLSFFEVGLIVIAMFMFITILLADKFEKPCFYMIFLIMMGLQLLIGVVAIVIFIIVLFNIPKMDGKSQLVEKDQSMDIASFMFDPDETSREGIIFTYVFLIIKVILGELVGLYCCKVVWRARAYMIDKCKARKTLENRPPAEYDRAYYM